jgi:hypothetical protein
LYLGEPVLKAPAVGLGFEEPVWFIGDERAGKSAHIFDAVFSEPPPHFAERVPVFFRMAILIAQPGFAAGGLGGAVVEDGIARYPAFAGHAGDGTAQPER